MFAHLRSRFSGAAGVCLLSLAAGTLLAQTQNNASDKGAPEARRADRQGAADCLCQP